MLSYWFILIIKAIFVAMIMYDCAMPAVVWNLCCNEAVFSSFAIMNTKTVVNEKIRLSFTKTKLKLNKFQKF